MDKRLKRHSQGEKQKAFWEEAIVFTSKDDYITKTQIQYLESEIHRLVVESGVVELDNSQTLSGPHLSEVDTAEMKHFLSTIKLIMASLGIDILERKRVHGVEEEEAEVEKVYTFSVHEARARMRIEEDKYIVLEGSTAVIDNRDSALPAIARMRQYLIDSGVLRLDVEKSLYVYTDDYMFNSPSYAAASVGGGSESGRRQWRYKGKNLNQMEVEVLE